jgi:L-histidine N-alpha-methyltransferase
MSLRSCIDQEVNLGDLGVSIHFAAEEEMCIETSAKFRRAGLEAEMASAGLRLAPWWTDPAGDYSLSLWQRQDS